MRRAVYDEAMAREVKSYESWKADRPRAKSWAEKVLRALPTTRRERPRDPEEARLLRRIGTPERLIGPVETPPRPKR
jgi:hypothetical protein